MKWHNRSFVSFLLVWSFIIVSISGLILYITPYGRVAYWVNWRFLSLTKDGWTAVHTIVGYLFIVASAIHLIYNFRVLMSYLKRKAQAEKHHLPELLISLFFIVIVTVATIGNVPPFSTIMNLGESLKESWAVSGYNPPIPHAELMTIHEFSKNMGLPVESVTNALSNHGFQILNTDETLKSIAERYNASPADIYKIIQLDRGEDRGGYQQPNIRKHRNRIR